MSFEDTSCSAVRGMVYGAIWMQPGHRIKANFGEEPFVFDTSVFDGPNGLEPFVKEPSFVFQTSKKVDSRNVKIGNPLTQFVG